MFAIPQLASDAAHDPIRLADWVELNLLFDEEPVISLAQVTNELAGIPPDDSDDSERRFSFSDDDDTEAEETTSGFWETAEDWAEAGFSELRDRATWLGDAYPLEVNGETVLLSTNEATRNVSRFLILLRARQLYQGAMGDDAEVSGRIFESLVKHALGTYVDTEHRVRFGVAGGYRGSGLPDSLPEAIEEMRQRLHEERGIVPSGAEGDYKADAIAWKPFGDRRPGQLLVIGQATISEGDWTKERVARRWTDRNSPEERLINLLARPVTAVAFPETLSLTSRETLKGLVYSSIPFDRLRLLSLLRDDDLPTSLRTDMDSWVQDIGDRLPR
ncbi:MAG: hypothetical protein OXK79_11845 [Chloroflexota bacterium]|nr:hypothetical protein [Chloroflexota bacterium]